LCLLVSTIDCGLLWRHSCIHMMAINKPWKQKLRKGITIFQMERRKMVFTFAFLSWGLPRCLRAAKKVIKLLQFYQIYATKCNTFLGNNIFGYLKRCLLFYVKFATLSIVLMQHDCRIHYFACIHGRIIGHPTLEFTIIFSVKMIHTFDQYSMSIWLKELCHRDFTDFFG